MKLRFLVHDYVVVHGTEGGVRSMLHTNVECVNNVLFEMRAARVIREDPAALGLAVLVVAYSQDIHLDTGSHQGDYRIHVLRDTGSGV